MMKIRKSMRVLGLIAVLFSVVFINSSCGDSQGAPTEQTSALANLSVPDSLKKADELYAQRGDLTKLREAIQILRAARANDSNNFEVAWKLAQYNYFLGTRTEDEKEKGKAFEQGINAARAAINLKSDSPEGHFWLGANLGGRAKLSPMDAISDFDEIRQSMKTVIKLNEKYQGASAYMALGQLELETDGFFLGGDKKKALEYLEKGFQLNPENVMLRLRLAQAYVANKREYDAKQQIEYILKAKPDPNYLPEHNDCIKEAKEIMEKIS